jgi:glycerate 2-kinase
VTERGTAAAEVGRESAPRRSDAREAMRAAFEGALRSADPLRAIERSCAREGDDLRVAGEVIPLDAFERVMIVGAGKATPRLARGVLRLLRGTRGEGTVATRDGHAIPLAGIDVWEAGHPLPDARSLAAAAEALRLARRCTPRDLLLCLLSGGASSLWSAPVQGVTLGDLRGLTQDLLRAGASIHEINTVRKHLSRIAGGRLALASPAGRIVTIAVSDVVGSEPEVIGSGPTAPDPGTYADALGVLSARGVAVPARVRAHLTRGAAGGVEETPGPSHPRWQHCSYHVVASVRDALRGAEEALDARGYRVEVRSERMVGEAREVSREAVEYALRHARDRGGRLAFLWGGEPTVTVRGAGRGGRCQEMAVAAAAAIAGLPGIHVGCLATDGSDGPTFAAGGVVDGWSVDRATRAGVQASDSLRDNASLDFLHAARDLVVTGPTGTNVNDLLVILVDRAPRQTLVHTHATTPPAPA